jgi:hypothetical protein
MLKLFIEHFHLKLHIEIHLETALKHGSAPALRMIGDAAKFYNQGITDNILKDVQYSTAQER